MVILRNDEIAEMGREELEEKLDELKLELSKDRAQVEIGGIPENPGRMKELKRTIARIKTRLSEI